MHRANGIFDEAICDILQERENRSLGREMLRGRQCDSSPLESNDKCL